LLVEPEGYPYPTLRKKNAHGFGRIGTLFHSVGKIERRQMMIDLIKKTLTTGLGLAFMTKEKIEELTKELVEKGKLSEKDARELIDELLKKSKGARKKVEGEIEKVVTDTFKRMNVVTRDDFFRLEKKLEQLTKAVKERESKD
jgi:polyhydroxyalkanoate synthesis regulator phasin